MDIEAHKLREIDSINVGSCISALASCTQFFAVGCLDDAFRVWRNKFEPFSKQTILQHQEQISGLSDICFTNNCTRVATTSLDSSIKIWDLDTRNQTAFDVPMLSAWKIMLIHDVLITCGDLGKVNHYDLFSKQIIRKAEAGDACLTAAAKNHSEKKIVVGNVNGDAYLFNIQDKKPHLTLKPHYKTIRSISFDSKQHKIISSSDDTTIALTDIETNEKQHSFEGHLDKVTNVKCDPHHHNLLYSCSFDKSIKIWDTRMKDSVHTHHSGTPLWALQIVGKHVITGGQSGVLHILHIE